MANLGSENTPIEGESFGLPSGFSIDEDSGNLAIRDTNGNVVAEWDETNAQWDFANNTLNNVDALNSNSVNTDQLSVGDPLTPSEDHRNLIGYVDTGVVDTVDVTISDVPIDASRPISVEVLEYRDRESSENNPLEMSIGGVSDINYTVESETLAARQETGMTEIELITPTATSNRDAHAGQWTLDISRSSVAMYGRGAPSEEEQGEALAKASTSDTPNDPCDLSFSNAGEAILQVAVWAANDRSVIQ